VNVIKLADYGTDLSSRTTGMNIRGLVLTRSEAAAVTVDCAQVRTMSASFADELFGILVADNGKAWFRDHVQIAGMTESIRLAILDAIDARIGQTQDPNETP
jgi:hypothetical protein